MLIIKNKIMNKSTIIESKEIERILKLHNKEKKVVNKIISEQTQSKSSAERLKFFADAKTAGCLTDPNLDYNHIQKNKGEEKYFIFGKSKTGNVKRVYDDYTYMIISPENEIIRSGTWKCDAKPPDSVASSTTDVGDKKGETLNANQLKVLDLIKNLGWFHDPAPTDVEVDQGIYEKQNVVDANTEMGQRYSKYFSTDFPNGFFIYKKASVASEAPGKAQKVEITSESCKTSIESLWDHLKSPNSYPLTAEEIQSYKKTAETCAEPANRSKFLLRFGLKNKLEDLSNSWIRVRSRL